MSEKQAPLNGAYYGPSVPPRKSYLRPGRSRGCGCGCCLLTLLLEIIVTVVVIVGLAAFIFWLIFRPNLLKYHVTDAQLTQFNLTTTTSNSQQLNYNLRLNLTLRNPNKKIGVYYDRIEARAYYEGQRFHDVTLPKFYQGHKNTTILSPTFEGQRVIVLGSDELSDFNSDKAAGVYDIDVKLYLRVRFKLGKIKTFRFKPKIKCDLKVPVSTAGSASDFGSTKCDFDW
ncbi:NDR1/HIN1-like protein 10 [Punica granatum]|uniref:Late embryogenesis abundant protein LEA-2 subgroup domain-containing protein n=2 Tax=Punica granatum TaxID=22663 RepID=A0A218X2Z0_PUNGR|nr:NDR1/HIN1-like protein 10 [Punica granatum]OWM79040.1 hypothetical protein CDL15_Pgr003211 [Punica granatum]PKI37544.1 hypothetical protein CRG98_042057 [Punica granatum]